MPTSDLVTAKRLTDSRVQTYGNVYLGHIEDVVVDPAAGTITHAIVNAEAGAGVLSKRRAMVPWNDLVKAYNDQVLTLDASEEQWLAYPEPPFDLSHRGLLPGAPKGHGASASWMFLND